MACKPRPRLSCCRVMCFRHHRTKLSLASLSRCSGQLYGRCCWFISAVFSWNRSDSRCCVARYFCTHRVTQPLSRDDTDLDVKSSMHDAKQWSTRPEKTPINSLTWRFCMRCSSSRVSAAVRLGEEGVSNGHEGSSPDCGGGELDRSALRLGRKRTYPSIVYMCVRERG